VTSGMTTSRPLRNRDDPHQIIAPVLGGLPRCEDFPRSVRSRTQDVVVVCRISGQCTLLNSPRHCRRSSAICDDGSGAIIDPACEPADDGERVTPARARPRALSNRSRDGLNWPRPSSRGPQAASAARPRGTGTAWHHRGLAKQDWRPATCSVVSEQHHIGGWRRPSRHGFVRSIPGTVDHALARHDGAQRFDDGVAATQKPAGSGRASWMDHLASPALAS